MASGAHPGRPADLIDRVAAVLREVAEEAITPRWRALAEADVRAKSPGELVTVADEESERLLTARLTALYPGVPVVGEEATAADPGVRDRLRSDRAWLVDPIDGTTNFVEGGDRWSVMVALVEGGEAVVSWVWRPPVGELYVAERGAGATRNGVRLQMEARPASEALRGSVFTRFFDPERAAVIRANSSAIGDVVEGSCAGFDYPLLATGGRDFLLFWRTLPWDHAPGTLLIEEAGGYVRRIDGGDYRPDQDAYGLLPSTDPDTWHRALQILEPPQSPST